MSFRVRRKLVSDVEFLALPPRLRETFIAVFRELAVAESPILRGPAFYVEELRQKRNLAREGIYSVHVADTSRGDWKWRGVFFRRRADLVFFGFGPREPDFYERMARTREALSRLDDEK